MCLFPRRLLVRSLELALILGVRALAQLAVGENDPFSGRKFNSATLELTNKILLSAAVDATGNTRGVVIFSVRFR